MSSTRGDAWARVWLTLLGVGLAWYTWGYWGSIQIDCGREIYVPMSLIKGQALYRDIWYPYGPLPPLIQALFLLVFGLRLESLYALGIVLALAITHVVYGTARMLMSPLASFVAGLGVLLLGFVPGLFNFVFPYTQAAPMGTLLGLVTARLCAGYAVTRSKRTLVLIGLAAGAATLVKPEVGLGAWLLAGICVLYEALTRRSWLPVPRGISCFAPGLLTVALGYGAAMRNVSARSLFLENMQIFPGSIFMRSFGPKWIADRGLKPSLFDGVATLVSLALALLVWYAAALAWKRLLKASAHPAWCAAISLPLAFAPVVLPSETSWAIRSALVFPVGVTWAPFAVLASGLTKRRLPLGSSVAPMVLALAAIISVVRVAFRAYPVGYAIFSNTLAFVCFVACLEGLLRRASAGSPSQGTIVKGLLSVVALGLLVLLFPRLPQGRVPMATRVGNIYATPRLAGTVAEIASFMHERAKQGDSLAVMPDDVFLYAFSGTQAPSRWYQITPGLLGPEQERALIAEYERKRVRYILVTNRKTLEYGVTSFGRDYLQGLGAWIEQRYRQVGTIGDPDGPSLAVRILERIDEPATQ